MKIFPLFSDKTVEMKIFPLFSDKIAEMTYFLNVEK